MSTAQAVLPLPPSTSLAAGAGLDPTGRRHRTAAGRGAAPAAVRRETARSVLRPADGPYAWSLDPYRRSRSGAAAALRSWATLSGRGESGKPLVALDGASEALLSTLRTEEVRRDLTGQPIALGAALDPYPEVEERLGVTRSLLQTLTVTSGLDLHLTTRSSLVLRDLDLLVELDRAHAVTVDVPVPALDVVLAGRLEAPGSAGSATDAGASAAAPEERLEVITAIAAQGVTARLVCLPVAPELNDSAEQLEPLVAAARDAGAADVAAHCLELRGSFRHRFLGWLDGERPKLAARYRQLYGRRGSLRRADKNRVLREFRALRLAYGFPSARPGRG